jgi:dihydrofolate synthase/folylpolyglutamate synthase
MEQKWSDTLLHLLEWTKKRVDSRIVRRKRFSLLIKRNHYLVDDLPIIKITGTNGKGSVCAMLESIFLTDHKKTGLFTSPHLVSVTERIRINGKPVTLSMMDKQANALMPNLISFVEEYGKDYLPSFFEILILIALRIFREENVDIAIFEAGIGGYNDSTSLLPEIISAITTVSIDHQEQLGGELEQIAIDKAGITNDNSTLVMGPSIEGNVLDVIKKECHLKNVALIPASMNHIMVTHYTLNGTTIKMTYHQMTLNIDLKLIGHHQLENFAVVATIINYLFEKGMIKDLHVLEGVKQVLWPGRLEYIEGSPSFLLDVAHNPHALQAFKKTLDSLIPYKQRVLLYGASADKDYINCLELIGEMAQEIYLVTGFYRACEIDDLKSYSPSLYQLTETFSSTQEAFQKLIKYYSQETTKKVIVVVGSVFLVGEMRKYLNQGNK